jgi:DNA-directed RNA polymerase specialized sigma24 family protein
VADEALERAAPSADGAAADAALVAALAREERAALAALYDRHAARMLAVAHRVLGNRRDAEDLLHDASRCGARRAPTTQRAAA